LRILIAGVFLCQKLHRQKQFEEIVNRFVDLKDTSELMMDLAYSSLLLNSPELAEEVQRLEDYMDQAHTGFETLVLASKCENEDPKGFPRPDKARCGH